MRLRTEVEQFVNQVRSEQNNIRALAWDDAWTTDIALIDQHHRKFLAGVNDMFAHLLNGDAGAGVSAMVRMITRTVAELAGHAVASATLPVATVIAPAGSSPVST
jgi:hypothetical protein